jgi:hypothetical protein
MLSICAPLWADMDDILTLYNKIPGELSEKYLIKQAGDEWRATHPENDEVGSYRPCIVDLENGYIGISDEGTGGGTRFNQEVALFFDNDRNPYIAINEYSEEFYTHIEEKNGEYEERDVVIISYVSLKFLEYRNNTIAIVMDDFFPALNIEDFFSEDISDIERNSLAEKLNSLPEGESLVSYVLPRKGGIIKAKVNMSYLRAYFPVIMGKLAYEEFEITWCKDKARFIITDRK